MNVFDLGSKSKKVLKKLGAKPPPTKDRPWIIRVQRMTNMKDPDGEPLPAEKQYTDEVNLVLVDGGSSPGRCKVFGCSESQVFSMLDGSTNYCNLRNLVCYPMVQKLERYRIFLSARSDLACLKVK